MSETTYDARPRNLAPVTITERDDHSIGMGSPGGFLDGMHLGLGAIPKEFRDLFQVDAEFVFETRNLTELAGVQRDGEWLWRKSDQDFDREHAEFVKRVQARDEEVWEKHHEGWARRESELPTPLRQRLERFRANGGHGFETGGWHYELTASELAVLYHVSGGEDSPEVMDFAEQYGTSGNQHSFAKALAKLLVEDPDAAVAAVSAMSPLTGDADYSKDKYEVEQ